MPLITNQLSTFALSRKNKETKFKFKYKISKISRSINKIS